MLVHQRVFSLFLRDWQSKSVQTASEELKGECLCFEVLSGDGPSTGWVSLKLKAPAERGGTS